jgi:hypothetical protein
LVVYKNILFLVSLISQGFSLGILMFGYIELGNAKIHLQAYKNSLVTLSYVIDIQFADKNKDTTVWLENPEIHFQVYKNSFTTESYIINIQFADKN